MLEVKNLCFSVRESQSNLEIINDISFTLPDGELLVVTGPNGGGKSTLARLIMGISQPTGGKILFDGNDLTELSVTQRARLGIGYAFQQPPRFKGLTVRKLLSLAHGSTLPEDECCQYLTNVGLCSKDYLNREVDNSLSGGEVKRIEIATILARSPKLAIFDEPEAGIDLWSFSMLVDTFRRMHAAGERSLMIISHQERLISLADKIMVVDHGTVRAYGSKGEIYPSLMGQFSCEYNTKGEAL